MNNKSILLVDDEEIIVKTMCDDLQCDGYQVDIALSGQEGLDLFSSRKYNLVISDLIMKEMDGIELAGKLKEIDPQVKIIILTGQGTRTSAIDALRLGVSDYLLKPYDRNELSQKVKKMLIDQQEDFLSLNLTATNKKFTEWGLTEREIEVSKLMFTGKTKDEIASALFISKMTVLTHTKNIYKKLDVNSLSKFISKLAG